MQQLDAVLAFWFPPGAGADLETHREYWMWRMRGGADVIPLGHREGPDHLARLDRAIALARNLLAEAPAHLKPFYEFQVGQPTLQRKVIAAFGRHPHRNAVLGRRSTPEELAYLDKGEFPHQREIPSLRS